MMLRKKSVGEKTYVYAMITGIPDVIVKELQSIILTLARVV